MPWTKSGKLPPSADKLKGHERDIFVASANAALKEYKDEVRAIRTGLAAVNKYREGKKNMTKKSEEALVEKSTELSIDVEEAAKSGLLTSVVDAIVGFFLQQEIEEESKDLMESQQDMQSFTQKSLNDELMQATFIVLEPEVADLHGDTYDATEIRKACHSFNQFCRKAYLNHQVETDKIDFVESYIAPDDVVINDFLVKKGTWLAVAQFNDKELWGEMKSDPNIGVSIAAFAKVEEL